MTDGLRCQFAIAHVVADSLTGELNVYKRTFLLFQKVFFIEVAIDTGERWQ